MNNLFIKLAGFWASKTASNYLMAAIAAIVIGGVWYVKDLQVKVAACETTKQSVERYQRIAARLERELNRDRDDEIQRINDGTHGCLDEPVDGLLDSDEMEGS
jgi:hypothetical protein